MRWLLCGSSFALAVVVAIVTASIRADNIRERQRLDRLQHKIELRELELQRLSVQALERATPDRLVVNLRRILKQAERQQERAWQ
ncbi:MAG: hypothetical protein WCR59_13450 [Planctomycetota bacterium]|jgi:cell division protein FtsL